MKKRLIRSAAVAAVAAVAAPGAAEAATVVDQLVAFRDGTTVAKKVDARATSVRVGRRSCAVPARSSLAALVRTKPPGLKLRDFGSCSRRARDAGGLFVSQIGRDRNRGQDGWVYKVGNKLATAGAADPSGPFGNGLLRSGSRVTWFYCRLGSTGSCQRTLALRVTADGNGAVTVLVRGYDDRGRSRLVQGATVFADDTTASTDSAGVARFTLAPDREVKIYATAPKMVRSHATAVAVR